MTWGLWHCAWPCWEWFNKPRILLVSRLFLNRPPVGMSPMNRLGQKVVGMSLNRLDQQVVGLCQPLVGMSLNRLDQQVVGLRHPGSTGSSGSASDGDE